MRIPQAQAARVVRRLLTWTPITSRRQVSITSGISASGIPNESTTWLSTSASVGFMPAARTAMAGTMVIARRSTSGMRTLMKPPMTTWPA